MKPFGVVALIEAGGIEAFDLEPSEIAIMASSHSGEDIHVRTIQAMFRRAGVSQALLACGADGMPLDVLTAARAIYANVGFELVQAEPYRGFGKDLVGETWERDL